MFEYPIFLVSRPRHEKLKWEPWSEERVITRRYEMLWGTQMKKINEDDTYSDPNGTMRSGWYYLYRKKHSKIKIRIGRFLAYYNSWVPRPFFGLLVQLRHPVLRSSTIYVYKHALLTWWLIVNAPSIVFNYSWISFFWIYPYTSVCKKKLSKYV